MNEFLKLVQTQNIRRLQLITRAIKDHAPRLILTVQVAKTAAEVPAAVASLKCILNLTTPTMIFHGKI